MNRGKLLGRAVLYMTALVAESHLHMHHVHTPCLVLPALRTYTYTTVVFIVMDCYCTHQTLLCMLIDWSRLDEEQIGRSTCWC